MSKTISQVSSVCNKLVDKVGTVVVGKKEMIKFVILGILSDGNILFEDFPGLEKTLTAASVLLFPVVAGLIVVAPIMVPLVLGRQWVEVVLDAPSSDSAAGAVRRTQARMDALDKQEESP